MENMSSSSQDNKATLSAFSTNLRTWAYILSEINFSWPQLPFLIKGILSTLILTPLRIIESIKLKKIIHSFQLKYPPIFVIGCPRSGTTHLFNLLCQNQNFSYLTTKHAFTFPYAELISKIKVLDPFIKNVKLERPMDNVELTLDSPQEDEFAFTTLSALTPYLGVLLCRRHYIDHYLTPDDMSPRQKAKWRKQYLYTIKKIAYLNGNKPLILKNPANTGRIKELLTLFPDAKFIHIYRNPYNVFKSLVHHLEVTPKKISNLSFGKKIAEELAINFYKKLMITYFEQKNLIQNNHLAEVKYEDLIENPLIEVKRIYDLLQIQYDRKVVKQTENYIKLLAAYKTNFFDNNSDYIDTVNRELGFAFNKLDYSLRQ
jgi:hypothetical protein